MRDRLIELIRNSHCVDTWNHYTDDFKEPNPIEELGDYLLANGVIVPPCKVGDVVWVYNQRTNQIYKNTVVCIKISGTGLCKNTISVEYRNVRNETSHRKFTWSQIGKQVFLTKEEAEKALKGGEG